MSVLTFCIILGIAHIILTTLFIIKGIDWFEIYDYVIYIIAPIMSVCIILITILAFAILTQAPMVLVLTCVVIGLPIGIAWLIKKVRK